MTLNSIPPNSDGQSGLGQLACPEPRTELAAPQPAQSASLNGNDTRGLERDAYLEERKQLVAAKLAQSTLFDRSILTLAAGAFAVSLTFVRQIVPPGRPQAGWVLGLAWVFIGASLLSTLISLLSSQSACQRAIGLLEDGGTTNRPAMLTKFLNWLSIAAFAAGVGLLAVFTYVNLN